MPPTLIVNCFLHPLKNQIFRPEMDECSFESHCRQTTPLGQRRATAAAKRLLGIGDVRTRFLKGLDVPSIPPLPMAITANQKRLSHARD